MWICLVGMRRVITLSLTVKGGKNNAVCKLVVWRDFKAFEPSV